MVRLDKDYRFTGPHGEVGLLDLFDGREQLVLQHFMFDPSWDRGADQQTAAGQAWLIDYVGEARSQVPFLRTGDEIFHTYATYGRGVEVMMHAYRLVDTTALGRREEWEEPKGRVPTAQAADPSFTS